MRFYATRDSPTPGREDRVRLRLPYAFWCGFGAVPLRRLALKVDPEVDAVSLRSRDRWHAAPRPLALGSPWDAAMGCADCMSPRDLAAGRIGVWLKARACIVADRSLKMSTEFVDALDLIILGRHLVKIGEDAIRGSHGTTPPTGVSLVLRDVFANPGSSITEVTDRTGLPQSYVSESIARLRKQGILETCTDTSDRRRTLTSVSEKHARNVAQKANVPVEQALSDAFGYLDAPRVLDQLAKRLRPTEQRPILKQLEDASTQD